MERRINNQTFEDVLKKLKEVFPYYAIHSEEGTPYIPYEIIKERLNNVLGLNWSTYFDVSYKDVLTRTLITIKCTLKLFDDEGKLVTTKEHVRSSFVPIKTGADAIDGMLDESADHISAITSKAFSKVVTLLDVGNQFSLELTRKNYVHDFRLFDGVERLKSDRLQLTLSFAGKDVSSGVEIFTFMNSEGNVISFAVTDKEKIGNYAKLAKLSPGSHVVVDFSKKDKVLHGIE